MLGLRLLGIAVEADAGDVIESERVVERQASHFVVEKIGEAREQLDRDHPQQQHQGE